MDELFDRFVNKVEFTEGCWNWRGWKNGHYGYVRLPDGTRTGAHRLAFHLFYGCTVPKCLVIDHLCKNKLCVNPDHLDLVTQRENVARGDTGWAVSHRNNTCSNGHERNEENGKVYTDGKYHCRVCDRERKRASYVPRTS